VFSYCMCNCFLWTLGRIAGVDAMELNNYGKVFPMLWRCDGVRLKIKIILGILMQTLTRISQCLSRRRVDIDVGPHSAGMAGCSLHVSHPVRINRGTTTSEFGARFYSFQLHNLHKKG